MYYGGAYGAQVGADDDDDDDDDNDDDCCDDNSVVHDGELRDDGQCDRHADAVAGSAPRSSQTQR